MKILSPTQVQKPHNIYFKYNSAWPIPHEYFIPHMESYVAEMSQTKPVKILKLTPNPWTQLQ